jgi:hypothetical protein
LPNALRALYSDYAANANSRVKHTTQVTGDDAIDKSVGLDLAKYFLSKATVDLKAAIDARIAELRDLGLNVVVSSAELSAAA